MNRLIIILIVALFASACTGNVAIDDLERRPTVSYGDSKFAGVFKGLDGTWRGKFKIYERVKWGDSGDPLYQVRPKINGDWSPEPQLKSGALKFHSSIDVEQVYTSETPYFQRVSIRDTYRDAKGKQQVVVSRGVNKIQEGVMWCVVRKPHETVIHRGSTDGKNVIIWQRELQGPQRIEYFHETVRENSYTIRGWGYYGPDDAEQPPRLWFLGEYRRVP